MLRKVSVALCLLALAAGALLAEEPKQEAPKSSLSAEQIAAKVVEALGGRTKLKAVQSVRMTGVINVGPSMTAPLIIERKRPASMRMEFTLQGMTAVSAFDGTGGWQIVPFEGSSDPVPMPATQAAAVREQADIDGPLLDYQEKGTKIVLVGKETLDGVDAYHLELTSKEGRTQGMYIDAQRFLPIKETVRREIGGTEVNAELVLSDYRDVNGLKFPFAVDNRIQGAPMSQAMKFDKIELNTVIDAARFKMPAAKKAPAPAAEPKPKGAKP